MLITFDRTNFPLIAVEEVGVEIHLLPITKPQFARFVAESGPEQAAAYQEMLALNPAPGADNCPGEPVERLFATGLLPAEARAFARWLGQGFDLPTVAEWRAVYAAWRVTSPPRRDLAAELSGGPAGPLLAQLFAPRQPTSMVEFSLLRGGLVEWVQQGAEWIGLGAPRPQFVPNLWHPLTDPVIPLRPADRLPYFGFRLIRRGQWYLSDKERVMFVD